MGLTAVSTLEAVVGTDVTSSTSYSPPMAVLSPDHTANIGPRDNGVHHTATQRQRGRHTHLRWTTALSSSAATLEREIQIGDRGTCTVPRRYTGSL